MLVQPRSQIPGTDERQGRDRHIANQELADSGLWDTEWSVGDVLGLDDATEGMGEGNNKPTKLVEFPEPEGNETLQEYLGQYKKAALNKKAVLKATKERLVKDQAVGHQCLDWYVHACEENL